MYGFRFIHKIE